MTFVGSIVGFFIGNVVVGVAVCRPLTRRRFGRGLVEGLRTGWYICENIGRNVTL
jgi:hypothetical protein